MKKLIIDVDTGTDDYLALLYLLNVEKRGEVKILGVVCTSGNTTLDHVVNNVVRLLEIEGRTDIPVYKGSKHHLILHKQPTLRYHGEDGFGDLEYDEIPDVSIVSSTPAAVAINNIVNANPNEVSLICLGPLTNLALSLKLYDELNYKIKDLWLMGGNYTGMGNTSCAAEFNFYIDPEAAYMVLESLKCPIYLLPWETCLVSQLSLEWRFEVLGNSTPALDFLTKAEKIMTEKHKWTHYVPCDVFLAFCFTKPEKYITKSSIHHVSVELRGELTRGQAVLDHLKLNEPNVTIIKNLNRELFMEELLKIKN